jgi:hypothetical protein
MPVGDSCRSGFESSPEDGGGVSTADAELEGRPPSPHSNEFSK